MDARKPLPHALRRRVLWGAGLLAVAVIGQQLVSAAQAAKEGKEDTAGLEKKLTQVLANQERILERLDEMMEELQVIKVRATR